MWEACRWNDDSTYHTPMVVCNGIYVFAGDIVDFCTVDDGNEIVGSAKVMSFYTDEYTCMIVAVIISLSVQYVCRIS